MASAPDHGLAVRQRVPVSYLSRSSLSLFWRRPERWRRRYVERVREPSGGPALLGTTTSATSPTGSISSPSGGYSISVRPDAKTLQTIARVSAGQAFKAEQADELGTVSERLGSRLGTRRERREVTAAFAAAGAVLLAGALLLAARRAAPLP